MKKLIALLLGVVLLTCLFIPLSAFAETAPPVVDLTPLVVAFALLVLGIIGFFAPKINRFLEDHNLTAAAEIAVKSAEALWGRYHGAEKLASVKSALEAKGYKIDDEKVMNAIRAAWQMLNMNQIGAGVKPPSGHNAFTFTQDNQV